MAKDEKNGGLTAGMMQAGKTLATGAPAALVTDTALQFAPVTWSYNVHEALRLGAGVIGTGAMLLLGVAPAWAAGPIVANGSVMAVNAGRRFSLAQKLRDMARPAAN